MSSPFAPSEARPTVEQHSSPRGGAGRDALVVVGGFVVVGLVCGGLWWSVTDLAVFTKQDDGVSLGELQTGKRFNADGWYAMIAMVAGLLAGGVLTWWRQRDFRLTVLLVLVGSAVAAAVMAGTGQLLGPGDPEAALQAAEVGERVPVQLTVTAKAAYLVWPIAALVGTLMVLWSPPKDEVW